METEKLASELAWVSFREPREFKDCYLDYCTRRKAKPTKRLALQTDPTRVLLNADQMSLADWEALFVVLQEENLIKEFSVASSKRKQDWLAKVDKSITTALAASASKGRPIIFSHYVLEKFIIALIKALIRKDSKCEILHLELPLAPSYCYLISQGITGARCLSRLSLSGSSIGDEGCKFICDALKAMPNVRELDLSQCSLGPSAVDKVTDLIKGHGLILSTVAWESSFRYRAPDESVSLGLLHLCLNNNPGIGDEGAAKLAFVLIDDNSLRSVGLRECSITTKGAIDLLGVLSRNKSLKSLDLGDNKISVYVLHSIKKALKSVERSARSSTKAVVQV